MVMLTRDKGFGSVGMKPEVASGLIRANFRQRQAGGLEAPGPGNMLGRTSVRGVDWVRRHHQGVPPAIRRVAVRTRRLAFANGPGSYLENPGRGPSPSGSDTEKLSYVTPNGMSTGRFSSKPVQRTQSEPFTALSRADCRLNKADSGHPHKRPPTYFQAISIGPIGVSMVWERTHRNPQWGEGVMGRRGQILICESSSAKASCIVAWEKQGRWRDVGGPDIRGHIPI